VAQDPACLGIQISASLFSKLPFRIGDLSSRSTPTGFPLLLTPERDADVSSAPL
jgi:hypothetical protein